MAVGKPIAERIDRCSLVLAEGRTSGRVRRLTSGPRRAVLFGECPASDETLARALTEAPIPAQAVTAVGSLPGAYGVSVTDGRETAVAGDLAGLVRIWFRRDENAVACATSPIPLAAADGLRLDRDALAAWMFCSDFSGGISGRPLFKGITELSPDRMLVVRDGRASVLQRPRCRQRTDFATASAALRRALSAAVERRVTRADSVTADFSGGLDSSSLALLATRYRTTSIPALTYTDAFAANDDDTGYATRLATAAPGLRQVLIKGNARTLPFTDMISAPFTDHPSLDAVIHGRDRTRLLPATGSALHLVGDGGDVVLGAPLTYLAALARPGTLRRFARESAGWARLRHRPLHRVVRAALAAAHTSYEDTLIALAARLEKPSEAPSAGHAPAMEHSIVWSSLNQSARWGTDDARGAAADLLLGAAKDSTDADGADAHAMRAVRRHAFMTRSFVQIAEDLGVQVAAPFFDHQVIAACMRLPTAERVSVDRAKPLLASAMEGLLPAELFDRRTKGDYTACEYHGVRRNAAALRALLHESRLGDLGIIRPDLVLRELETAVDGGHAAMAGLEEVFATEVWLRNLDDPPIPATVTVTAKG
ncbi:asparagine synthase (glutamine-hydrolyzing) [Spinactinospora alkalitolerans]|uniref:asparagine synthase (glutamine-hydrolyzing) n=1 Tax=Spinactinospora alkalitolerans TaxID=687207 RepID=A0A852TY33_9ACTN|nr:albusnodin/ikarugamycin family macrolactam cyclase [Spinactinospora alkalitolerans]NYE48848.1 asparagine synthase (glutamine-hydrolyzing) [Spinactinospora alkalitolerans]